MNHQKKINKTGCRLTKTNEQCADIGGVVASKRYETPVLIAYGDVRDITLGGTLGMGESGAGFADFDVIRPGG